MNPVYFRVILYFIAPLVALVPGIVYDANAQTVTIDLEAAATGLAVAGQVGQEVTWLLMALRSRVGQAVALVLAGLAALGVAKQRGRSQGRSEALRKVQDNDRQRADDIRRRARDADGVPDADDRRGWRD